MKNQAVLFGGGLSPENPLLSGDPGKLLVGVNYESLVEGGYGTTHGYEKEFDLSGFSGSLKAIAHHYALGVIAAGNHGTDGNAIYRMTGTPLVQTLVMLVPTGANGAVTFDDVATGVFPYLGIRQEWVFFASSNGRLDAVAATLNASNAPVITTFPALRPATAATTYEQYESFVLVHANHVFVSAGRSLFCSGLGDPETWTALAGSVEFGMDGIVTGLTATSGGVLLIYTTRGVHALYGTDADSFELRRVVSDIRISAGTVQDMSIPVYVTEGGILTSLIATQEFGNFGSAALSQDLIPMLSRLNKVVASYVDPTRSQYHLLYEEGASTLRHLCVTLHQSQVVGATLIEWPDDIRLFARKRPLLVEDGFDATVYGATTNGAVYVLAQQAKHSFDGDPIVSYLTTRFNAVKQPGRRKRFRRAFFEVFNSTLEAVEGETQVTVLPQFDGWAPEVARHGNLALEIEANAMEILSNAPGSWGFDLWDEFVWSGTAYRHIPISLAGIAESVAFTVVSERNGTPGHVLRGYTIQWDDRRAIRG